MSTIERIDTGNADGSQWGTAATDKLGCYGATPVVQASNIALLGTVVFSAAATGIFGFGSSTVATSVCTKIDAIITALINIGVLADS